MKKLIIFLLLISCIFPKDKHGNYNLDGSKGYYESNMANMKVSIENLGDRYKFTIELDSQGWVAIGFDSGFAMKDGEFLIINNQDGVASLEHHYGTSTFGHKEISTLDKNYKNEYVELISWELKDNYGIYTFTRKIGVEGKYFKELQKGKEVELLIAYRKDNNIKKKHSDVEHLDIILP